MNKKEIRNYIKLGIIIFITIILTIIICNIYRNYNYNKENISYLSSKVSSISYKELPTAVTELSSNSFIYLSYTGNKNIYELEKKIRRVIKQYEIEDSFLYVDCNNIINEKHTISNLNEVINIENITLPAIIYFEDNIPIDYIDSKKGLFEIDSFKELLNKYERK